MAVLQALVRYGAHLPASPGGQTRHGQNAIHGHRQSGSLSQRPHSPAEIWQINFQLVLRFTA